MIERKYLNFIEIKTWFSYNRTSHLNNACPLDHSIEWLINAASRFIGTKFQSRPSSISPTGAGSTKRYKSSNQELVKREKLGKH